MVKLTTVQSAHTYGVLDPHVIERRDTKFVAGSLSDGENIVLLPQGGYMQRGGTTDYGRTRRLLTAVAIDTDILSLPNGGTENTLLGGGQITISGATGSAFVLAELDFGGAMLVHFIDVKQIGIATTAAAGALKAEAWNGAAWVAFGQAAKITLSPLSRRFASGAPGHAGILATKFRIVLDATTAAGDIVLSGLALWRESATMPDGVVKRYAPEAGMAHQLVATPGNIDVYEAGAWRAAIAFPATAAMLREIKFEAKYDTILAFHVDLAPQAILRLGSSTEWACDAVAFQNVPLVDYGEIYVNGVTEVQEIELYDLGTGEKFDLTIEGLTTTAIEVDATGSVTAAAIAAALEALPNVSAGLTVTDASASKFTVTFDGAGNADREWTQMVGTALDPNGYVRVRTLTQGKPGGEPIVSTARGWPAVGRYAQQRLVMAGMKGRPNELLASVTGEPFNLNTDLDLATAAFSYEIDASENGAIRDMVAASKLLFFGDQQVIWLKNRVLSAEEAPEFGVSDAPGIAATSSPISSDNAIFYVQDGSGTLRLVNYNQLEENFLGDNASVLSAHLIRQPVDQARRRALGAVDSDVLVTVNGDGTAAALTLMRTQEVSGFAPWRTDGALRAVAVDHDNRLWLLAERQVGGQPELRLELQEPGKLLDEAIELTPGAAIVTGLARFNGRAVWAIGDGSVYGPFTVAGGEIELPQPVAAARVGTWIAPFATDPPVSLEEETRSRQARLKRVNRAAISVMDTTSLAIAVNGGDAIDVPLIANADFITDTPPLDQGFTGLAEAEGMHGFTDHGKLTVTQLYPGRLTVRSVTKSVAA